MYKVILKKQLRGCLYLLGAMVLFSTSCVDENYDLTKDIDLTVGVGTKGLSVKLGTTDKILLKDILEEDETIKVDGDFTYYMIEEGNFDTEFDVPSVNSTINPISFSTDNNVIDYEFVKNAVAGSGISTSGSIPLPGDYKFENATGKGASSFAFSIEDVDKSIEALSKIIPYAGTELSLSINLEQSAGVNFVLSEIQKLVVTFPNFLKIKEIESNYENTLVGQELTFTHIGSVDLSQPLFTVVVDKFDLGENGVPVSHTITLPEEDCKVSVDGTFSFTTGNAFNMDVDDFMKVAANVSFSNHGKINIQSVSGKFNPEINPTIDPIDIASSLPDFLQDEGVVLEVANPTLKVNANMTEVPMDILFAGTLIAEKEGKEDREVSIPETRISKLKENILYFSQQDMPYDPNGIEAGSVKQTIPNLVDLLKPTIPDFIQIDMSNNQIHVDSETEYSISLGRQYTANMDYDIMVPFSFNKGFQIVYKDSTESINDDLKDLGAEGVTVTTDVHTTIPLVLHATVEVLDANGKEIKLKDSPVADIPACASGKEEVKNISLLVNLNDPYDLSKIDRIRFIVHAKAGEITGSKELKSNQYLFMKDIRVTLNGQVIIDLN